MAHPESLIHDNLDLVEELTRQWSPSLRDEMHSAGMAALGHAWMAWEEKGPFRSFAAVWIRKSMIRTYRAIRRLKPEEADEVYRNGRKSSPSALSETIDAEDMTLGMIALERMYDLPAPMQVAVRLAILQEMPVSRAWKRTRLFGSEEHFVETLNAALGILRRHCVECDD